jgi:hypothetical protein
MRVVVVVTVLPFESSLTEDVSAALCQALAENGHEVERFDLPLSFDPQTMMEELLALRLLDLRGTSDRLIAIGTGSYVVKHDHKVVWLIDDHAVKFLSATENGDPLHSAHTRGLRESRAIFAGSDRWRERFAKDGVDVDVLEPELETDWNEVVKRLLLEHHSS